MVEEKELKAKDTKTEDKKGAEKEKKFILNEPFYYLGPNVANLFIENTAYSTMTDEMVKEIEKEPRLRLFICKMDRLVDYVELKKTTYNEVFKELEKKYINNQRG